MGLAEIIVLGVALSMDAFAVAICKGLSLQKLKARHAVTVGAYFGIFQGVMPALGFLLAFKFEKLIDTFSHWIAFALLLLIGANMIKESLSKEEEEINPSFGFRAMFPLAVATSIDAMAVGVSFALIGMTPTELLRAVIIIAVTTFLLSMIGVKIGHVFGAKHKSKAEMAGGIVLILIGLNVVLNHYGIGSEALIDAIKGLL